MQRVQFTAASKANRLHKTILSRPGAKIDTGQFSRAESSLFHEQNLVSMDGRACARHCSS